MAEFDASKYLTKLKGKDYLEVKWRLLWLRTDHPNATLYTEIKEHELGQYAIFYASVSIPDGGSATGWGSETKGDFTDYIEKAETKAIGRALAALGYGTQFCDDHSEADAVVDSPVARPKGPTVNNAIKHHTESLKQQPAYSEKEKEERDKIKEQINTNILYLNVNLASLNKDAKTNDTAYPADGEHWFHASTPYLKTLAARLDKQRERVASLNKQ